MKIQKNLKRIDIKNPETLISSLGILVALCMFVYWCITGESMCSEPVIIRERITGFVTVSLFVIMCIKFVPIWLNSWNKDSELKTKIIKVPKTLMLKIFTLFLVVDILYIAAVVFFLYITGQDVSLDFWLCLDSGHYIDIARDGYISSGDFDRVVQLVFLPGYPLAIRMVNFIVRNYTISGMIVSALFFGASGCAFYKLLRLDFGHKTTMRTIKYLLIVPGVFFFVAPMSESMYLFFCLLCIYFVRTNKVPLGCVMGAVAAFTRSVGMALTVPVFFELIHRFSVKTKEEYPVKKRVLDFLSIFIIPLGFVLYCYICYRVSGNPLKFMQYQSEHWGQEFGFFFAKVVDQLERSIVCFKLRHPNLIGWWFPNFVSCFGSLIIMNFSVKKLRPSYSAWFIVYYFITIGVKSLLSGPRYLLVCFPLLISLGLFSKRRYVNIIFTVLCLVASVIYTYAFVMRWNVW